MHKREVKNSIFVMLLALAMVFTYLLDGSIGNEDGNVYAADSGPNTQYSLSGAEYWVYTNSACTKRAEGAGGKPVALTTGSDGTTNEVELEEGTYYVKEAKASKGYVLDTTVYKATVSSGETGWVNQDGGKQVKEVPQSAPLSIQKADKETGKPVALGGASLKDAQFQVTYTDGADISRKWVIKTGADGVAKLDEGHKVSGPDLYKNSKGECVVPLGKVTISEIEPSTGYLKNTGTITITVGWDGQNASDETTSNITASGATEGYALSSKKPIVVSCPEQIKRGDVKWNKIAERTHARLAVPFVIKSATTGEAHVVFTDVNGFATTHSSDAKGGTPHSVRTNGNDKGVIAQDGSPILDEKGHVDTANLNSETGIWFSKDKKGNTASEVNDSLGALPYDTYYISELPTAENDGFNLVKDVKFVVSRNQYEIEGGTLDNQEIEQEEPEEEPEEPAYDMYKVRNEDASVNGDGEFGFQPGDYVTYDIRISNTNTDGSLTLDVYDKFTEGSKYFSKPAAIKVANATENSISEDRNTVNITIKPGETATVTYGATVLQEAKEYLSDNAKDSDSKKDGADCNKADRNNKPDEKDGYRNMAYTVNVWYEKDGGKKTLLDNKEDDAQTPVRIPEIGTYLADDAKQKTIGIDEETTLIDTVSYKGLTPGRKYAVVGELMVKETGKPLTEEDEPVKAVGLFTAKSESGSAVVEFVVNTKGLEGKHLVAFETAYNISGTDIEDFIEPMYYEVEVLGTYVAEHRDLNDKDQTVLIEAPGEKIRHTPETGDRAIAAGYMVLLAAAAFGLVIMIRIRKRDLS